MRTFLVVPGLALLLIIIGCTGSGNTPVTNNPQESVPSIDLSVGVSEYSIDGNPAEGYGALGAFTLDIDPDNVKASLNPVRKTALPDTLEVVDITNFLMLAPCSDCAKIQSVALDDDGKLVVTIGIKHPFDEGDPFKPITGRNRGDLHVFNIEGIVAAQDSETTWFPSLNKRIASTRLINASGYTPYLDSVLDASVLQTDADIHPYILHFDDYSEGNFDPSNPMGFQSVTNPPPSGNLVMAMGCDFDYKDYVFDLQSEVKFTYVVGCTYAVSSAAKNLRFTPEYRVPQHMKKAASEVHVIPPSEYLQENDPSFETNMFVHVLDPSHDVEVGDNLDQMFADSSVGSVQVEIPGVLSSPLSQNGSDAISGTGHDPGDPLVFEFTFSNELSATEGYYAGLVKITDTYVPGLNESPLLDGKDGIERVDPLENPLTGVFDIPGFATYAVFTLGVELGYVGTDPVADLQRGPSGCYPITVTLDASDSYDLEDDAEGIPLNFEFDYDYDGINFVADRPLSTDPIAEVQYDSPGCYVAAVRVWDSDSNSDIANVIVPVTEFNLDDPEVDITDGTTTNDIWYRHGLRFESGDVNWPGMSYQVVKGAARGNGYIYTLFRGFSDGRTRLFFSRSDDNGATWSTPESIHEFAGSFAGCSIDANENGQVLIVWADHTQRDIGLIYSTDNGESFSSQLIEDNMQNIRNPDVAIDPTNPDKVIISIQTATHLSNVSSHIFHSVNGASGNFEHVFVITSSEYRPGWVSNIYHTHCHFSADGTAYMICGENSMNFVQKSSDGGMTWPNDSDHRTLHELHGWYREMDSAFDPIDPNIFYVVRVQRTPHNPRYPVSVHKSTDGFNLTQIHLNVNDNTSYGVYKFNPSVTVNDAGVVYVAWQSNHTSDWNIMLDYSCDGGITFGTDHQVNTIDIGDQIDVYLVPNSCGDRVIAIWEQNGLNPDGKLVARKG